MSPHPFLVDQRPYLPRNLSTESASSSSSSSNRTSSSSTSSSSSSSRTYTTYSTAISLSSSTSSQTPSRGPSPIEDDIDCARFMAHAAQSEHLFGSVGTRRSRSGIVRGQASVAVPEEGKRSKEWLGKLF